MGGKMTKAKKTRSKQSQRDEDVVKSYIDVIELDDIMALERKQLQKHCKRLGLKANGKTAELQENLYRYIKSIKIEEDLNNNATTQDKPVKPRIESKKTRTNSLCEESIESIPDGHEQCVQEKQTICDGCVHTENKQSSKPGKQSDEKTAVTKTRLKRTTRVYNAKKRGKPVVATVNVLKEDFDEYKKEHVKVKTEKKSHKKKAAKEKTKDEPAARTVNHLVDDDSFVIEKICNYDETYITSKDDVGGGSGGGRNGGGVGGGNGGGGSGGGRIGVCGGGGNGVGGSGVGGSGSSGGGGSVGGGVETIGSGVSGGGNGCSSGSGGDNGSGGGNVSGGAESVGGGGSRSVDGQSGGQEDLKIKKQPRKLNCKVQQNQNLDNCSNFNVNEHTDVPFGKDPKPKEIQSSINTNKTQEKQTDSSEVSKRTKVTASNKYIRRKKQNKVKTSDDDDNLQVEQIELVEQTEKEPLTNDLTRKTKTTHVHSDEKTQNLDKSLESSNCEEASEELSDIKEEESDSDEANECLALLAVDLVGQTNSKVHQCIVTNDLQGNKDVSTETFESTSQNDTSVSFISDQKSTSVEEDLLAEEKESTFIIENNDKESELEKSNYDDTRRVSSVGSTEEENIKTNGPAVQLQSLTCCTRWCVIEGILKHDKDISWKQIKLKGGRPVVPNRFGKYIPFILEPSDLSVPSDFRDNYICGSCVKDNESLYSRRCGATLVLRNSRQRVSSSDQTTPKDKEAFETPLGTFARDGIRASVKRKRVEEHNSLLVNEEEPELHTVLCKRQRNSLSNSHPGTPASPVVRKARGEKLNLPRNHKNPWRPKKTSQPSLPKDVAEDVSFAQKVEAIIKNTVPGSEEELSLIMSKNSRVKRSPTKV